MNSGYIVLIHPWDLHNRRISFRGERCFQNNIVCKMTTVLIKKQKWNVCNLLFVFTVKMNFDPKSHLREISRELKEGRTINLIKKDSERSQGKPEIHRTQRQHGKRTDSHWQYIMNKRVTIFEYSTISAFFQVLPTLLVKKIGKMFL